MYTDGQIITKEEHVEFANWANANGGKFYSEPNGDGTYTVREVVVVEPTIEEKNEAIKQARASLYAQLIDPLHAQRDKDIIMGEWSEEREQEYIAEVKRLTIKIREENPYETVD